MKELIIIVYKINVGGFTRDQASNYMSQFASAYNLSHDEDLEKNFTVKEIYLPIENNDSDVKIIYPIPKYTTSPEINDLVIEISNKIKEDPTNGIINQWNRLVRELKLRKINSTYDDSE